MILRVGPQLKPFGSYRKLRWRNGAPMLWIVPDQGGGFKDISENRYAVTINAATLKSGQLGPAVYFNGAASLGMSPPTLAAWTWMSWIKPDTGCNGASGSAGSANYGHLTGIGATRGFWLHSGKLDFFNGGTDHLGATAVAVGVWCHLAGSYDSTTGAYRLYYNGHLDATGTVSGTAFNFNQIGADSATSGDTFTGWMDDIRIYPRVLGDGEVMSDYLDPWWRLRRKRPWWMATGFGGGGSTLWPWWLRSSLLGSGVA